jgi:hypothetical protein
MATISDLEKAIEQSILDLPKDEQLCSIYTNVCAYSSNKGYLPILVDKVKTLILKEKVEGIYAALSILENSLFTERD